MRAALIIAYLWGSAGPATFPGTSGLPRVIHPAVVASGLDPTGGAATSAAANFGCRHAGWSLADL